MGKHLQTALAETDPDGFASLIGSTIDEGEALTSLDGIPAGAACSVVARLAPATAERLLAAAGDERVTNWLKVGSVDDGRSLLTRLPPEKLDRLVNSIEDRARRRVLRRLAGYPPGSVGALARTRVLVVPADIATREIGERIRSAGAEDDSPVVVTRRDGSLLGVLDLMRFLREHDPGQTAADLCLPVEAVHAGAPVEGLQLPDDWGRLTALPVIDASGNPIGFVSRSALERARAGRSTSAWIIDAFIELTRQYLDFLAFTTSRILGRRAAP